MSLPSRERETFFSLFFDVLHSAKAGAEGQNPKGFWVIWSLDQKVQYLSCNFLMTCGSSGLYFFAFCTNMLSVYWTLLNSTASMVWN